MSIFELQGFKIVPDIIHPYQEQIKNNQTPLIIENGKCYDKNPSCRLMMIILFF